tara:strand:+ start:977 stop:1567 length:591 start_codon:yes stop_codon:yes gene_type:complete
MISKKRLINPTTSEPKKSNYASLRGHSFERKINTSLGDGKVGLKESVWNIKPNMTDAKRHVLTSQYTTEALRNKLPFGLGNTRIGRLTSAIGANILGMGHEIKSGITQYETSDKPLGSIVRESAEDLTNNFAGSIIGAGGNAKRDSSKFSLVNKILNYLPDGLHHQPDSNQLIIRKKLGILNPIKSNTRIKGSKSL